MADPLVVGVLYPSEWNLDFDRHLAELVGFGPINQAVARRARAFDLEVIVVRSRPASATRGPRS